MNDTNYCVISKELLLLLRWLSENESTALKKLVSKACDHGFATNLKVEEDDLNIDAEEAHAVVFDFFTILEDSLNKVNEKSVEKLRNIVEENDSILPCAFDFTHCDKSKLTKAFQSTASILKQSPSEIPKDVFFKEFLKTWVSQDGIIN